VWVVKTETGGPGRTRRAGVTRGHTTLPTGRELLVSLACNPARLEARCLASGSLHSWWPPLDVNYAWNDKQLDASQPPRSPHTHKHTHFAWLVTTGRHAQETGFKQLVTCNVKLQLYVSGGFTPDIVKLISKSQLLETECKHYDLFIWEIKP
jgi:hypothetical protein